jgi:GTP cyclohydrolase II
MEHASAPLSTAFGNGVLHCFAFGPHEEDNILCLQSGDLQPEVLVRVQSACYTAEIFRSTDCDCHEQLEESSRLIFRHGGVLVYMLCDGRGAGLLTKLRGLSLGATDGLDTYDAYARLGVAPDPRDYSRVIEVLTFLKVQSVRLLTNNPRKVAGLIDGGIPTVREPLEISPTDTSIAYLRTKRDKFGHLLDGLESRRGNDNE